jgi:hypothetical protein
MRANFWKNAFGFADRKTRAFSPSASGSRILPKGRMKDAELPRRLPVYVSYPGS